VQFILRNSSSYNFNTVSTSEKLFFLFFAATKLEKVHLIGRFLVSNYCKFTFQMFKNGHST